MRPTNYDFALRLAEALSRWLTTYMTDVTVTEDPDVNEFMIHIRWEHKTAPDPTPPAKVDFGFVIHCDWLEMLPGEYRLVIDMIMNVFQEEIIRRLRMYREAYWIDPDYPYSADQLSRASAEKAMIRYYDYWREIVEEGVNRQKTSS